MDLKEGPEEIAAAESQHFLYENNNQVFTKWNEIKVLKQENKICSSSTWLGSTSYPCLAASVLPMAKLMTYPTIAREKAVLTMPSH